MAKQRKQQNVVTVSVRPGIALDAAAFSRAQTAAQAVIDAASTEAVLSALVAKAGAKPAAPVIAKATKPAKATKAAKPAKAAKAAKTTKAGKGKRARVVLDDAKRKQAIQAFKNGATADKVAKDFGVSIATSNNIKRAAGLTKKRKGKR